MTVRRAKFTDIPRIVELAEEAHERSIYNETEVQVDVQYMKRLLMTVIQRHGGKGEDATYVQVSERDGVVEGCLIVVAQRIQWVCNLLQVSDLFFYQSLKAYPNDAKLMMKGAIEWARSMKKKVYQIRFGAGNALGDYTRTAKLYERLGFSQKGGIYGMKV